MHANFIAVCYRSRRLINKFNARGSGYVLERRFTKFGEISRSRSFKVTDFGTNRKLVYDFLLVIDTNLPPIFHRFQVMADYWSNCPDPNMASESRRDSPWQRYAVSDCS